MASRDYELEYLEAQNNSSQQRRVRGKVWRVREQVQKQHRDPSGPEPKGKCHVLCDFPPRAAKEGASCMTPRLPVAAALVVTLTRTADSASYINVGCCRDAGQLLGNTEAAALYTALNKGSRVVG